MWRERENETREAERVGGGVGGGGWGGWWGGRGVEGGWAKANLAHPWSIISHENFEAGQTHQRCPSSFRVSESQ